MKKVFVHLHKEGEKDWENTYFHFERIPFEGEYFVTEVDGVWYKVELVVHTPTSEEMSAEIYAVKVNYNEEMNKKIR